MTTKLPADTKIERLTRTLRVELTTEEVAKRADRCAHLVSERATKKEQQKSANAHASAEVKQLDAELNSLSNEVRDRAKYSEVECERRYNYRLGRIEEVRLDTNKVVSERAMNAAERQLENGLKDPEDAIGPALPTAKKGRKKKAPAGEVSP